MSSNSLYLPVLNALLIFPSLFRISLIKKIELLRVEIFWTTNDNSSFILNILLLPSNRRRSWNLGQENHKKKKASPSSLRDCGSFHFYHRYSCNSIGSGVVACVGWTASNSRAASRQPSCTLKEGILPGEREELYLQAN